LRNTAAGDPKPWLSAWTVLAAATGARNGELCGLEWEDVDLAHGTVRFRQELTIVDVDVLPGGAPEADGRRKELAVGPMKSKASKAILSLPPFAEEALRRHRHQQARLRLAGALPATVELRWVEPGQPPQPRPSWTWCFAPSGAPRSTPTTPAAASPTSPDQSGWTPTRTCSATRWPRPWRPTRNRPPSSPRNCATPTAAPSPSASTSTNSPRPHPG
jgi:hypothetical protein